MPEHIFMYNNAAGRLYHHLKAFVSAGGPGLTLKQFTEAVGVAENWDAALMAISEMKRDYEELDRLITDIKENEAKHGLWKENLNEISKSLHGFVLNMQSNSCSINIIPSAIVALQFIAADLPKETDITKDELEELRKQCDDLRKEIIDCEELPKSLKTWLLELVRMMRDSIDRYKIRGSRGLSRDFHEMMGSLFAHMNYANETKEKAPTVWVRMMSGLETMVKLSNYAETAGKGIPYVRKALEYMGGDHSGPSVLQ